LVSDSCRLLPGRRISIFKRQQMVLSRKGREK
jgi:hypothetical protein